MKKGLTLHKEVWWRGYTGTYHYIPKFRLSRWPRVGFDSSSKASLSISSRTSTLMHLLLSLRLHPCTPRYAVWSLLASWLLVAVATETVASCGVITETTERQYTILETIIRFVPVKLMLHAFIPLVLVKPRPIVRKSMTGAAPDSMNGRWTFIHG